MEKFIGSGRFNMPTDVALSGEVLADLTGRMVATGTFVFAFGLYRCQIFLAIFIGFEPIGELQKILALENIHNIIYLQVIKIRI
jgi:hypothetical protein